MQPVGHVESRQRLAGLRIRFRIRVTQGVQQCRADARLALHESGSEPSLRRSGEHGPHALPANRRSAFVPAVRCADDRTGAQKRRRLHPPWSVQRELQTHATADGISCVVEGFGAERVGEDEHRGGEFGHGERLGTCPAAVPGQIPADDADVRGQLLRHGAPQRRRRGAEGRPEQQQRPVVGSAEVDGGETGNAHEASLTKRRARFNVESIN